MAHLSIALSIDHCCREPEKNWRPELAKAFQPTRATVQPLLKGWLLTSPNGKYSTVHVQS